MNAQGGHYKHSRSSGAPLNYEQNPLIVYWEMTQACPLACRHCRAEAMPAPHPLELTTVQSKAFLRQIRLFGDPLPHLILTGGDPLQRRDLFELIDEATALGLNVSITPSATEGLSHKVIARLRDHGIQSLGLSLDGSNPARHEAVRGVQGCFDSTIRAARDAGALGIPVQINTLVCEETADDLPSIYELLTKVMRWSLFFLIPVGRGKVLREVTPQRAEELMNWIYDRARESPFAIKTTEAPFYRRVALNRMIRGEVLGPSEARSLHQGFGIRDGNGIVFVSNRGDVYPAGFLPAYAGNVRSQQLSELYRNSPVFRALRTPRSFKGKCSFCEYQWICGGSRARAFAHTGNFLESDPLCSYQPGSIRWPTPGNSSDAG